MKLLICATEYYPHGSGIANVAHKIVEQLKKKRADCKVCSPTGPDIFLGNRKLILKLGRIGLLYYWLCVSRYFNNEYNNKYDIVWLHQPLFLYKNPFKKCLITIHITAFGHYKATKRLNYPFYLRIYYLISLIIEKYCIKKRTSGAKFITDSPEVSKELKEIIGIYTKTEYIPNGVDINIFKPINNRSEIRKEFNIPMERIVLIAVGRLTYQKKIFLMIDIFNKIQKNKTDCLLIIVGTGELNQQLKNYINKNNITNIQLMGFISDEELQKLYACSDYYIMTSEYEGQPLTLLEAMASGLPCIVSDIPNLKIVEDANCGIVVDFSDEEKAAQKILNYIKEDNSMHARNARKYAEDNLDWSIIAGKYLKEFETINNKYYD